MEYCSAGDLEKHLLYEKFTESRTVFYAACIILGLKYLHKTRIVHWLGLNLLFLNTQYYNNVNIHFIVT